MNRDRIRTSRGRARLRGTNCMDNGAEYARMLSKSWREYVRFRPRALIVADRERAVAEFRAHLSQ